MDFKRYPHEIMKEESKYDPEYWHALDKVYFLTERGLNPQYDYDFDFQENFMVIEIRGKRYKYDYNFSYMPYISKRYQELKKRGNIKVPYAVYMAIYRTCEETVNYWKLQREVEEVEDLYLEDPWFVMNWLYENANSKFAIEWIERAVEVTERKYA